MIMSFQELISEEHVLNLVFCLNYFDYSQSVGRWVGGPLVGGSVFGGDVSIVTRYNHHRGVSTVTR